MINWDEELERIFDDPLFADIKAPKKPVTSSDRLIAGFQEIADFCEENGRLPEDNPTEARLFHMLQGILASEKKINRCRPFDKLGILPQSHQIAEEPQTAYQSKSKYNEQLEAVFNDPLFADIPDGGALGIFDIPDYMRQRLEARKEAEYIGKRVPCEDFDRYEAAFKEIHQGLKSGKYRLVKFSAKYLQVGCYFIEDGVIGYLAALDNPIIDRFGMKDGRTRVIYENGTESDIKYKTITKNLSVTGYSVVDCSDMTAEEYKNFVLGDNDVESGTIYVLRSKSTRPEIATIKNLYKIGFTVTSVESRIANAKNEPTYLCDAVEVVATWKVYNVKSSTFEALIHKLFAAVQLQVMVDGQHPQEWFVVPLNVIEEAVTAIIQKKTIEYNPKLQQIVYLS